MLDDYYKVFVNDAMKLPNFKVGTKEDFDDITSLSNGYCNAQDEKNTELMTSYLSALFVRYWYMVPYLYERCSTLKIEMEDCVYMLLEAFTKAFKNRAWLNDSNTVGKDSHGAQKVIEKCIESVRATYFTLSNYDKRKVNYLAYSIEESAEIFGDGAEALMYEEDVKSNVDIELLIMSKLRNHNILSAMIIDCICFQDCSQGTKFSFTRMKDMITEDYLKDFSSRYPITLYEIEDFKKLLHMEKRKLVYNIKKELNRLKDDIILKSLYRSSHVA